MDTTIRLPDPYTEASLGSQDTDDQVAVAAENLTLSSIGSSFFTAEDNVSLDSSNQHHCILSGVENMSSGLYSLDESCENTILSSHPSSSIPPAPQANRDVFMLSPHPQLYPEELRSVTTTNTEVYAAEQLFPVTVLGDNDCEDEGSMSLASSQSTSVRTLLNKERPSSGSFEDGAFERVADSLLFDSSNNRKTFDSPNRNRMKDWHDRLVSDSDWDRFRATSKDILPFISEDSESVAPCTLPLPPKPLPRNVTKSEKESRQVAYRAEDHLPSEFICGICKDVLVGACILDCNCTVCMNCWEGDDDNQQDFAKRMDFVWVEDSKKCQSCHIKAEIKVSCHALDVAILRIIQGLPDSDPSVSSLKESYFHRLLVWRKAVSDRNEKLKREKMIRDDELLARLIQEEERVFWNNQTKSQTQTKAKPSNKILFLSKAVLAIFAVVGLKHFSKRR